MAGFGEASQCSTCFAFCKHIYGRFGLKHIALLLILLAYLFLGALTFYMIEGPPDKVRRMTAHATMRAHRSALLDKVMPELFNETNFLLFVDGRVSEGVRSKLQDWLEEYESFLNVKRCTYQHIEWDFWNAMLYSGTIVTTIGYGHLYPTTDIGRVVTMIYSIFGIPLVFMVLSDLGKLLTKLLKFPWFLVKKWGRRLFQYCSRMTHEQIKEAEEKDEETLEVFDLPVPIAVCIVIGYIFLCAAIFCIWEQEWDYLVAFYFFFISLSTIGLGDVTPDRPHYLLMMFGLIMIGMSLVSMCINLIQAKFETTYKAKQPVDRRTSTASPIISSPSKKAKFFGDDVPDATKASFAFATADGMRITSGKGRKKIFSKIRNSVSSPGSGRDDRVKTWNGIGRNSFPADKTKPRSLSVQYDRRPVTEHALTIEQDVENVGCRFENHANARRNADILRQELRELARVGTPLSAYELADQVDQESNLPFLTRI